MYSSLLLQLLADPQLILNDFATGSELIPPLISIPCIPYNPWYAFHVTSWDDIFAPSTLAIIYIMPSVVLPLKFKNGVTNKNQDIFLHNDHCFT